jgi:hypothetical protein
MSKATRRTVRKQLDERAIVRRRDEAEAKQRRLNGFKPATTGEMLSAVVRQPNFRTGHRG